MSSSVQAVHISEALNRLTSRHDDDWLTLPPWFYDSPAVFELEKERIFRAGWICIGREDQVAKPGDYYALDVLDEPLLMLRDDSKTLRVFSNVCRHRWMQVCRGKGNTKALVCPYHSWTYRLDGTLRHAPLMQATPNFDPSAVHLSAVRHEVWQGFVYVNLDAQAEPLAPRLEEPRRVLEAYNLESWRVVTTIELPDYDWDWKVMQDNGECYHHVGAHLETFEPNYPARQVETQCGEHYTLQFSPTRPECRVVGADGLDYAPGYFPPVSGLSERQRVCFVLLNVLPNFFIYVQPDYGMNMRMYPLQSGKIRLCADIFVPPGTELLPDFDERLERAVAFFHRFNDEDVIINQRVQQGLRSHFAEPAWLSEIEGHNRHFARWFIRQLQDPPSEPS